MDSSVPRCRRCISKIHFVFRRHRATWRCMVVVAATSILLLMHALMELPDKLDDRGVSPSTKTHLLALAIKQPQQKNSKAESERTVDISLRFQQRRQHLKEACSRLNISISGDYPGLPHADHRFIFPTNTSPIVLYCPVPKTGTTFLKQTFGAHNNYSKVIWIERFSVRPVNNYDDAIMFFFTREPYSRILSSYVDKLWSPNLHFWRVLGRLLVRQLRPNATQRALECGSDVTFPEFVRYFIEGQSRHVRVNSHLIQTHKFCEVCKYDYDYVGKLETFREDVAYILDVINVTSAPNGYSNDNDVIMDHIGQAYYTHFIDTTVCLGKRDLLVRAWRALQIRGLISSDISFPLSESDVRKLNKKNFTRFVYRAVKQTNRYFHAVDNELLEPTRKVASRDQESDQSDKIFQPLDNELLNFQPIRSNVASLYPETDQSTVNMRTRDYVSSLPIGVSRMLDLPITKSKSVTESSVRQSFQNLKARDRQRKMALASAYSLIPMSDKLKIMELMKEEFDLFDYEAKPEYVFSPKCNVNPKIFDMWDV